MLNIIFSNRKLLLFFILWIVEFFHFLLFPRFLINIQNDRLLILVFFLLFLWFLERRKRNQIKYEKLFGLLMILLLLSVVFNCISCYYFRAQSSWETLINWSPILLLLLYYPLSVIKINIRDWERILLSVFILNLAIRYLIILYPPSVDFFKMDMSVERYLEEHRLRLISDGILFLGNLMCFNNLINHKDKTKLNLFLFLASWLGIFLMGFRTAILANVISCAFMFFKRKKNIIKYSFIFLFGLLISFFVFINIPMVQDRIDEIVERNKTQNFRNEDYVRVLLVNYYYTNYFKSSTELFFGSGMVYRVYHEKNYSKTFKESYPSDYSKLVSYNSQAYHFFPVDMGLIGLSWEAGIPAAIILFSLCIVLFSSKVDNDFLYIKGWGLFLILTSVTLPFYYYHKNMIYTAIVFVIFMKMKRNLVVKDKLLEKDELKNNL